MRPKTDLRFDQLMSEKILCFHQNQEIAIVTYSVEEMTRRDPHLYSESNL